MWMMSGECKVDEGEKGLSMYAASMRAGFLLTNTLSFQLVQVTIIQSWSPSSYSPVTMQPIAPLKLSGILQKANVSEFLKGLPLAIESEDIDVFWSCWSTSLLSVMCINTPTRSVHLNCPIP